MTLTKSQLEKLLRLSEGSILASSNLNKALLEELVQSEAIVLISHGRNKSVRAASAKAIEAFVADKYNIVNIRQALEALSRDELSRADQVALAGDSKLRQRRTFKGFLVNCYQPVKALLCGADITLLPPEGSYSFIYNYEDFHIPEDVVIIGVENSENFRQIKRQRYLFDVLLPGRILLFISRYPQSQSKDLISWLTTIKNDYIHFGDLDLAGVSIYLSEFYAHLGTRASFLLPPDYDNRLAQGSRERYTVQLSRFRDMKVTDPRVQPLLDSIHRHRRGYDQEGFIPV